jgi:hypothetical protein
MIFSLRKLSHQNLTAGFCEFKLLMISNTEKKKKPKKKNHDSTLSNAFGFLILKGSL